MGGERSSSGDETQTNESALNKRLNNGTRKGDGYNDTEEYYSNSESEEEWAGLDNSELNISLQSPTASSSDITTLQKNKQIWDFLSILLPLSKTNKAVMKDVENHSEESETIHLLHSEGTYRYQHTRACDKIDISAMGDVGTRHQEDCDHNDLTSVH